MHCPKCGHAIKRLATMRTQKLVCPQCGTWLEPVHMRAPLLAFLLASLPVQLTSLSHAYQFRPGPGATVWLAIAYAVAWAGLIFLFVREARRPRLKERMRPKPEIVLGLNAAHPSQNSK